MERIVFHRVENDVPSLGKNSSKGVEKALSDRAQQRLWKTEGQKREIIYKRFPGPTPKYRLLHDLRSDGDNLSAGPLLRG